MSTARKVGVEPICEALQDAGVQIAPSTYDAAKGRPPWRRSITDTAITEVITTVRAKNGSICGSLEVRATLRSQGHRVAQRCAHPVPGPGHDPWRDEVSGVNRRSTGPVVGHRHPPRFVEEPHLCQDSF